MNIAVRFMERYLEAHGVSVYINIAIPFIDDLPADYLFTGILLFQLGSFFAELEETLVTALAVSSLYSVNVMLGLTILGPDFRLSWAVLNVSLICGYLDSEVQLLRMHRRSPSKRSLDLTD